MSSDLHPWADRARGMLLAAAAGDALGWPHERRDRTRQVHNLNDGEGQFLAWQRTFSRFRPFIEEIGPGEYSDDTQMIIAVARARLALDSRWLTWLQHVEWPFFPHYERGAGASVKRACRAWAAGIEPWTSAHESEKYFATGANGAAMRIAPHVIARHSDTSFQALAADVVHDAATTHGHPRAIVGALVHAYALWASLRKASPLSYGWIVHATLDGIGEWRRPVWEILPPSWQEAANGVLAGTYGELWDCTVREVEQSLRDALVDLESGAVSAPSVFLRSAGLCSAATRGSGTLSAAAAIYLAARSAVSPEQGLALPAHLPGADTDTLASMTGSLLGAALGHDWLGSYGRNVQDSALLNALAEKLLTPRQEASFHVPTVNEMRGQYQAFSKELAAADENEQLTLPNQRSAEVVSTHDLHAGGWRARHTKLLTDDGQTLSFIHDVRRAPGDDGSGPDRLATWLQGVYLPVTNVGRIRHILENVFGLVPLQHGDSWVAYENLVFRRAAEPTTQTTVAPAHLRLAVADIEEMRGKVELLGAAWVEVLDSARFNMVVDPYLTISVSRRGVRRNNG